MNPTRIGLIRAARQRLSAGVSGLDRLELEEFQDNTRDTRDVVTRLRRTMRDTALLLDELLATEGE